MVARRVVAQPDLVIDMHMGRRHLVGLGGEVEPFLGQR